MHLGQRLTLRLGNLLVSAGSTLLNDLVAYWALDEQSGARADALGTYSLTDNNTVLAVRRGPEGPVGNFVRANAESLSKSSAVNLSMKETGWTGAIWFRTSNLVLEMLMSKDLTGGASAREYGIYLSGGNAIVTEFFGLTPNTLTWSPLTVYDGKWHLYVFRLDGSNVQQWLDGTSKSPTAYTGTCNVSTNIFYIGNRSDNTHYWDGQLGAAGIWQRSLSTDEINTLFALGNGVKYADLSAGMKTSLISWWDLDEASGTRYDSTGTNDLTDNNTVGSTTVYDCKDGSAASIVRTNFEYLQNTTTDFFFTGDHSISVWFYATASGFSATNGMLISNMATGDPIGQFMVSVTPAGLLNYYDHRNAGDDADGRHYTGTGVVSFGAWHHLVLTMTGTTAAGWLDGAALSFSHTATGTWGWDNKFLIGAAYLLNNATHWNGYVDEVGLWNRALTSDEVAELYNAGAGKFYDWS